MKPIPKMKTGIERLLGANWRPALTSLLTAIGGTLASLAGVTYALGDVAVIISPEWKQKLFILGLALERGCQVMNGFMQKDKRVSGNKAEGYTVAKHDEVTVIPPEIVVTIPANALVPPAADPPTVRLGRDGPGRG